MAAAARERRSLIESSKVQTSPSEDVEVLPPPESFDARQKWPNCTSMNRIYDEGECFAGWAIAPAHVLSDSLCIASKGKINVELSAAEILSCFVNPIDGFVKFDSLRICLFFSFKRGLLRIFAEKITN